MKTYYGVRYFSMKQTTIGEPNKSTGRYSIACQIVAFSSEKMLEEWLYREDLSAPSGCGGGTREEYKKSELRGLCLGLSVNDFNDYIDSLLVDEY